MRENSISGDFKFECLDKDLHILSAIIRRLLIDNNKMDEKSRLIFDNTLKVNCFEFKLNEYKYFKIEMYNEDV